MRFRVYLLLSIILTCLVPPAALAQASYEPVRFNVAKFVITGDNPIGDKAFKVLQPFVGEQYGLEGLSAAADALEQAIIKEGFSFHRVSLPPQQLTTGSVQFEVIRFSIGAINISGNNYFDRDNIEHSLPLLRPGTTPNTKQLSRSLKLANNHASKNILLKFKEGGEGDTIDAELKIQEQNPQLVFVTLDNTGSKETKEFRSTLGYQHGNLFNRDHALTATLTFAPEDPAATTQMGLSYRIPLYEKGANLDFLLSDSEVNSGSIADNNEVTGKGSVLGFTYSKPMLTDTNFNHEWSAGVQFKKFDNETPLGIFPVDSFPLALGYTFSYNQKSAAFSGGLNYAMNIGAGGHNTDEDYSASTFGRVDSNSWSALRYNLSYDQVFAKSWMLHGGLSGQSSGDLLISGEQFGVGGSRSLRGFEERSVAGDQGYQFSIELWMPPLAGIRYLVFVDLASVELNDSASIPGVSYDLSSVGAGMRWSWKQQLSISLDAGVITKGGGPDVTINQDDDAKAHFSLIYRF